MKRISILPSLRIPFLCLALFALLTGCGETSTPENTSPEVGVESSDSLVTSLPGTSLVVVNGTDSATTVVFTLAASGGTCSEPLTAEALASMGLCTNVGDSGALWPYAANCTQVLAPHDSIVVNGDAGVCLSGTVTFDALPNCPCKQFPNGVTQAEFTLNPSNQSEAIDITLVNGNSYVMSMDVTGDPWLVETTEAPLAHIQNLPYPSPNSNNPGIYPSNCTVCIDNTNPPCPGLPATECDSIAVCQLERNNGVGGNVTVTLVSRPAQGINASLIDCPGL